MIEYLVLGGGGIKHSFYLFGIYKNIVDNKYIEYNNIKKIYATSAGCVLAIFIGLKIPLDELGDWIINCPWHKFIDLEPDTILSNMSENGLVDIDLFYKLFTNLFLSIELNPKTTLLEFYNFNKLEINMHTTCFTKEKCYSKILNYKTMPDLPVVDAIYMSSCVPGFFKPIIKDDIMYLDGFFYDNVPIHSFLTENPTVSNNSVLVMYHNSININEINKFNIIDNFFFIIYTYIKTGNDKNNNLIDNYNFCINCKSQVPDSINCFFDILYDTKERSNIVNKLSYEISKELIEKFKIHFEASQQQ
jgi:hypothetical protein